jgi:hypothetical protein
MKNKSLIKRMLVHCVAFLLAVMFPVFINGQENSPVNNGTNTNNSSAQTKEESSKFEDNLKYLFEIGGQYKHLTGDRATKLEEYGQIRSGLLFRRFRISSNPPNNPEYFRILGRNAGICWTSENMKLLESKSNLMGIPTFIQIQIVHFIPEGMTFWRLTTASRPLYKTHLMHQSLPQSKVCWQPLR